LWSREEADDEGQIEKVVGSLEQHCFSEVREREGFFSEELPGENCEEAGSGETEN